jgi:hypothetical protein
MWRLETSLTTKRTKSSARTKKPPSPMSLTKTARGRVIDKAKTFAKRSGGQKKLIPLLGTSDTFMTPEELRAYRDMQ